MPRFSRASTNPNAGDRLRCAPGGAPPKRRRDWLSCGCGRHTALSRCGANMTGDAPGTRKNAGRQCTQSARARAQAREANRGARMAAGPLRARQYPKRAPGGWVCLRARGRPTSTALFLRPGPRSTARAHASRGSESDRKKWHNGLSRQAQREPSTKREGRGSSQ